MTFILHRFKMKKKIFATTRSVLACLILFILLGTIYVIYHFPQPPATSTEYYLDVWQQAKKIILQGPLFLQPVPSCSAQNLKLVVIVISAPQNYVYREAIRSTWGKDSGWTNYTEIYFAIGKSTQNTDKSVDSEHIIHGDIIRYSLVDSYSNLTLKSVAVLKWATTKCVGAEYIMKSDDDMFVNIPLLLHKVLKPERGVKLIGRKIVNSTPYRNKFSRYYVSYDMYPEANYPNYVVGSGYVMTQSTAALLLNSSFSSSYITMEDVFVTGICARNSNVTLVHSSLFHFYVKNFNDPCKFLSIVTATSKGPQDLYKMWNMVHDVQVKCVTLFWENIIS